MGLLELALLLLVLLIFLLGSGVWVALGLAATGYVAMALVHPSPGLFLAGAYWESAASWTLAALPMFIWMGEILFRTRLSNELFNGIAPWVRRLPGRLMHVNIFACGLFGCVSGSSAATCATVSKIALPELAKRGYDQRTAIGSLATAGTLGLLLPPSIIMVVYAVAAEVSIVRIFIAGFIPGLMVVVLFSAYIAIWALLNPQKQPAAEPSTSFGHKLRQSAQLIPCVLLILSVIGSMLGGIATATEAAAFGVAGSLVLAAVTGSLTWQGFKDSLAGATRLSCMILFILAGAAFLTKAMALTGIPAALAAAVASAGLGPYAIIAILTVVYILLGTSLDGVSMIVLTTSVVVPMVQQAGFDLIWFGIFIILLVEIGQITPPLGFNLFVMQSMTGKEQTEIALAALPFFAMLVLAVALITVFPGLVTALPDYLLAR
ncbi:TRAP transporter large permease [Roseococcus suduntuyensis]|uniref:TRAP transporter large permease protein n=1 Tax=Roseococcus suduntuyensis TaxID=455361 RepID=A0A840A8E3_9PROT|nr:TRAP transporter large permease subunit [Roseococcus suduntuyensis]MBB3896594.1 tripartite ATP-independent transporter DctM subunit [Roseococcus suduntuyensis]